MVKFTSAQAHAAIEIHQLINEYARDLDLHHGQNIGDLVTEDCSYNVMGGEKLGRAAVRQFYSGNYPRNQALPTGVPTARHLNVNPCIDFRSDSEAAVTFNMTYFTSASGSFAPNIVAVADVRMDMRKDADGHWRIARFDSNQPFKHG